MKKNFMLSCCLLLLVTAWSQNTINGKIKNKETDEGVGSVSVMVKGASSGTFTDEKGEFALAVPSLPVTILMTSIGFETQETNVSTNKPVIVSLNPVMTMGQEVV